MLYCHKNASKYHNIMISMKTAQHIIINCIYIWVFFCQYMTTSLLHHCIPPAKKLKAGWTKFVDKVKYKKQKKKAKEDD